MKIIIVVLIGINTWEKLLNQQLLMKVYSVKGDTENEYIYTLWDWERAFYRKQE